MEHLPAPVRSKAIDIANALLEKGVRGRDGDSHCHRQGKGVGQAARFAVIPIHR
jgi:hypothetical protein